MLNPDWAPSALYASLLQKRKGRLLGVPSPSGLLQSLTGSTYLLASTILVGLGVISIFQSLTGSTYLLASPDCTGMFKCSHTFSP